MTVVVPWDKKEACMCEGFGITLFGPALNWWKNLSPDSITYFSFN